jgi:acyl dehydratase
VFHGDTIRAETVVRDPRETSDGDRGVVTMDVEAYNQDDTLVCSFERIAPVERRP